jgi:hypothetical protein
LKGCVSKATISFHQRSRTTNLNGGHVLQRLCSNMANHPHLSEEPEEVENDALCPSPPPPRPAGKERAAPLPPPLLPTPPSPRRPRRGFAACRL